MQLIFQRKKKCLKHNLTGEHIRQTEIYFNNEVDDYAKAQVKTETKAEAKADSENDDDVINNSRKDKCTFCNKTFRSEKSVRTHENIQWRENLESSDLFKFTSFYNHHQLYISRLDNGHVTDIKKAVNYVLDNIIPYKAYKNEVAANCL